MKREEAIATAKNFYTYRMGYYPKMMKIVSEDLANGKIVFETEVYDDDDDGESTYQIEIDDTKDSIVMRRVVYNECRASDFRQVKMLSTLRIGELFRLEQNMVVYRYCGTAERYGKQRCGIARVKGTAVSFIEDVRVYPCGSTL